MDPLQIAMNLIAVNERGWVAALKPQADRNVSNAIDHLLSLLGVSESMQVAMYLHNAILHLVGRHDLVHSRGQLPLVETTNRLQAELEKFYTRYHRPVGGIQ